LGRIGGAVYGRPGRGYAAAILTSVIVCTRNRADLLEVTLRSLLADRPATDWELIVVDNASTDRTRAVVDACRAGAPDGLRVEHLVEDRLGHSHARNRGIAAARGEVVFLADDDVRVEPGFVDALVAAFDEPDVLAAGGKVVPEWPSPPPRWMSLRNASLLALTDYGDEPRDLVGDEFPIGASMAIRASELAGEAFDTRLGHRGGAYFGFDEYDLFQRLRERGRLVYCPDAVVHHRMLPERMTFAGMRRAALHNGYGSMRAERLRGAPGVPRRKAVPAALRAYAGALRAQRRNGGRGDADPAAAFDEFHRWWVTGRWVEVLFGDSRRAERLLERLA
jgi:glycosyltransferase involved in cell wall biosynthesis